MYLSSFEAERISTSNSVEFGRDSSDKARVCAISRGCAISDPVGEVLLESECLLPGVHLGIGTDRAFTRDLTKALPLSCLSPFSAPEDMTSVD